MTIKATKAPGVFLPGHHSFDKRDTENMKHGEKSTAFCIECKVYHRIQMGAVVIGTVEALTERA